jgi:hypothetical protein
MSAAGPNGNWAETKIDEKTSLFQGWSSFVGASRGKAEIEALQSDTDFDALHGER